MACQWCHNPEGIDFGSELLYLAEKCVGCGECLDRCPEKALSRSAVGIHRADDSCTACATCVATCPALAHEVTGRSMTIAEIMAEITKELPFFDQSGGGITCSGGEPLSQPEGLVALLEACGRMGIHRAVDTSGHAPTAILVKVARHTDLFLYDLKHMDSESHKRLTGVANELILGNLMTLSDMGCTIRVRIPLIAGVNDDPGNIEATGAFVAGCKGVQGIDVLPFHSSATAKYRKLGKNYCGVALAAPPREHLAQVVTLLKRYCGDVNIGG